MHVITVNSSQNLTLRQHLKGVALAKNGEVRHMQAVLEVLVENNEFWRSDILTGNQTQ